MPIGLMFALALNGGWAQGVSLPQPLHQESWVTADDYPIDAINKGQSGTTYVDLYVDARGKAYRCDVLRSSGAKSIDNAVCGAVLKRARFVPATDFTGQPVAAVFQTSAEMNLGAAEGTGFIADGTIALNRLPGGLKEADVTIVRAVSADGKVEGCKVTQGIVSAALDKALCRALVDLPETAVTDVRGAPVRALRERHLVLKTSRLG